MSITVSYKSFTFLRPRPEGIGIDHAQSGFELPEGATARELVARLGLRAAEVEAVFVNGRVQPHDTMLGHGGRIALVPPGTPGPHRALLGLSKPRPTRSEPSPDRDR